MKETQQFTDSNTEERNNQLDMLGMVSHIVAGYVSNHTVEREDLPRLMKEIQRGLLRSNDRSYPSLPRPSNPAVAIEDSVTPEHIICLEDGRRMKMLKRHLKKAYNLTPEQYRTRWGLPANYPMTAPNYAIKRQGIAKNIGLGTHRKKAA